MVFRNMHSICVSISHKRLLSRNAAHCQEGSMSYGKIPFKQSWATLFACGMMPAAGGAAL